MGFNASKSNDSPKVNLLSQILHSMVVTQAEISLERTDSQASVSAGKASLIIVEPGREEAKADLQDAMSRTAKACMSGKDTDEIYHDLILLASSTIQICPQAIRPTSRMHGNKMPSSDYCT